MVEVNEALIRKVAELSRLELSDQEVGTYVQSIGDILKHVEQLALVDVEGVEPMNYGVDGALRLREDEIIPFATDEQGRPKILKSAPEVVNDGFKVPPIIG